MENLQVQLLSYTTTYYETPLTKFQMSRLHTSWTVPFPSNTQMALRFLQISMGTPSPHHTNGTSRIFMQLLWWVHGTMSEWFHYGTDIYDSPTILKNRITLLWPWQISGDTYYKSVRHPLTTSNEILLTCCWYYIYMSYTIILSFAGPHKFKKSITLRWNELQHGYIWSITKPQMNCGLKLIAIK